MMGVSSVSLRSVWVNTVSEGTAEVTTMWCYELSSSWREMAPSLGAGVVKLLSARLALRHTLTLYELEPRDTMLCFELECWMEGMLFFEGGGRLAFDGACTLLALSAIDFLLEATFTC